MRLAQGKTAAGELWAFVHDTTPPRIQEITVADSVSATVDLSQTLDPRQRLAPERGDAALLPDSTPVRVDLPAPKPVDDSLNRTRSPPRRDTTARTPPGRRDPASGSVPEAPPARAPGRRAAAARPSRKPLTSRPPLTDRLVLRVRAARGTPSGKYEVEIRGVRNVSGVAGDVRGGSRSPSRPPPTRPGQGRQAAAATATRRARPGEPAADSLKRGPTP